MYWVLPWECSRHAGGIIRSSINRSYNTSYTMKPSDTLLLADVTFCRRMYLELVHCPSVQSYDRKKCRCPRIALLVYGNFVACLSSAKFNCFRQHAIFLKPRTYFLHDRQSSWKPLLQKFQSSTNCSTNHRTALNYWVLWLIERLGVGLNFWQTGAQKYVHTQ